MNEIVYFAVGVVIGTAAGYILSKKTSTQNVPPEQTQTLASINVQITEIKTKFNEIEKSREVAEKHKKELEESKEARLKEFMEGQTKLFKEINDKNSKNDEEKEKRLKEIIENQKKFFMENKDHFEKFLTEQGKSRAEIEKKRDAQLEDMKNIIDKFNQTISGTSSRGQVGEIQLESALANCIKSNVVVKNLKTNNGSVEFAWNLEDGKYIPIDSKLPDVFEIVNILTTSQDNDERKELKKKIIDKVKKQILEVKKYQNQQNTIDCCILVVPDAIIDLSPEIISVGRDNGVFVTSYTNVFVIAHTICENYSRLKQEGDLGKYKLLVKSLFLILDTVQKKVEAIDRAVTTIDNANQEIKTEVIKGKSQNTLLLVEDK